ncbi:MAG TPA: hypothetical protein VGO80_14405 [Solirubrobacteraceae bacterium]|jgi:hypothetical protein|nr:hypothetical protein [Solirubrobacteraceae bacterium]
MKRIALPSTIVAAIIAAAAFAASGSAESPSTTSLHLISTTQESVGFAPNHDLRPGDRFGTGDIVRGDDSGIDRLTCTVTSKRDALCTAVAQLSKGTLTAQSLVSLRPGPAATHYAITGGTGAYEGASGTAVVTDIPGTTDAAIDVTLLP